jgi:hypothetical protein
MSDSAVNEMVSQIHEMFPSVDEISIKVLCKELRTKDDVIDRLMRDGDIGWKSSSKSSSTPSTAPARDKGYRGGNPKRKADYQKKEVMQPAVSRSKPVLKFGAASNAGWGDLKTNGNGDLITPEPAVVETPPAAPVQQWEIREKPSAVPQQEVRVEPVAETVLQVCRSLSGIVPIFEHFGTFAGPIKKPQPKIEKQKDTLQFVQSGEFEKKASPSPPPPSPPQPTVAQFGAQGAPREDGNKGMMDPNQQFAGQVHPFFWGWPGGPMSYQDLQQMYVPGAYMTPEMAAWNNAAAQGMRVPPGQDDAMRRQAMANGRGAYQAPFQFIPTPGYPAPPPPGAARNYQAPGQIPGF